MIRLVLATITPFVLLPAPSIAEDAGEQPHYIIPRIPSEAEKKAALMLGYHLNGDSMRSGSVDVTGMLVPFSLKSYKITPPKDQERLK